MSSERKTLNIFVRLTRMRQLVTLGELSNDVTPQVQVQRMF
jgi:hypothetical protein